MLEVLQRYSILAQSLLVTAYYSIRALAGAYLNYGNRARSNFYVHSWAQALLNIIKLEYELFNPHHITFESHKRYIIMCNHASLYDIPLSIVALGDNVRMLSKKELSRIPIFGQAMRAHDFIFIDRNNREQAIKDLQKAKEKMESGIIIWIAPEGTRSCTGELQPFKKGGFMLAIETGATIVPLGIRGAFDVLAPKTTRLNLKQKVQMHLGEPIDASEYSITSREQLMQDVYQEIKRAAGL